MRGVQQPGQSAHAVGLAMVLAACSSAHVVPDSGLDAGAADSGVDANDDGQIIDARSDASPDGGDDIAAAFLDFCIQLGQLHCNGARRCCTIPERQGAGCSELGTRAYCEALAADPALRDGTLVWREADAQRHLDDLAVSLETCSAIDRAFTLGDLFEGTLGEGEECTPAMPELRSLGRFRCQAGLRCELVGTTDAYEGRCAPPGTAGASCNHDCSAGHYCWWALAESGDPFWGRCEAIPTPTECRSDYACESLFCEVAGCTEPAPADTWCSYFG